MSHNYRPLKTIFHETRTNTYAVIDDALSKRRESASTMKWNYRIKDEPIFVMMTTQICRIIDEIWQQELKISQLWDTLPLAAQQHYIYTLMISEIIATNEIENIHSTRKDIADALELARTSPQTHKPFQKMAHTFLMLFGASESNALRYPRTMAELRQLYDELLAEEIADHDMPDGHFFRADSVYISNAQGTVHAGVTDEAHIINNMHSMLDSAQDNQGSCLVNAMVEHFMLEHTHPFYDGNGRFGRFLLSLRLVSLLSAPTALSLSAQLFEKKALYYKAFQDAEHPLNHAELTFFAEKMLLFTREAQTRLYKELREKKASFEILQSQLQELQSAGTIAYDKYQSGILFILGQAYLFGPRSGVKLEDIAHNLKRTKHTIRPYLNKLQRKGLIDIIEKRPLIFQLSQQGITKLGL
ncbi:Fic family protein [Corynebacterium sp. sy017]|uniref:Fic family protein n=1 Tax=unclassified Corynebacterium TaxID=2624378 RepID=UPI0011859AB3|nr:MULTISPECIES: Fic family protein [unclassified Corynebacterium]MBP3088156.1 Fic family protein [Corynebacterium sp. sy017]TSD92666.1 Fic family protein [Corynebacterium sp. SY003]